jgi:hypothetical protein
MLGSICPSGRAAGQRDDQRLMANGYCGCCDRRESGGPDVRAVRCHGRQYDAFRAVHQRFDHNQFGFDNRHSYRPLSEELGPTGVGLHIRPTRRFFGKQEPVPVEGADPLDPLRGANRGYEIPAGDGVLASFGWRVSDLPTPCPRLFLSVHAVYNFALAQQCRRWRSRFYSDGQRPSLR